jgi:hypothetical protein
MLAFPKRVDVPKFTSGAVYASASSSICVLWSLASTEGDLSTTARGGQLAVCNDAGGRVLDLAGTMDVMNLELLPVSISTLEVSHWATQCTK